MKKLFFVFLLAFSFMSFSTTKTDSTVVSDLSLSSEIQFESVDDDHRRCRWRVCTYRNGVRVSCTPWTYGYCLDEVVITAQR